MKVFEGFTNIFKSDDYDDEDFVNEEDYIVDENDDDYETRSERRAKKEKAKEKKGSFLGGLKRSAKKEEDLTDSYYDVDDYDTDDSYSSTKTATRSTSGHSSSYPDIESSYGSDAQADRVKSFSDTGTRERTYERTARVEQPRDRKIVPLRGGSSGSFEVVVIHPQNMDDGPEITETLLSGKAVIISLEGINPDAAQRIMDYTAGSCYAIKGNLQKISNYIFLVAPSGVDISGDFQDVIGSRTDTVAYGNDFSMN